MFTQDLEAIDKLRSTAAHAQDPHASNIPKLQTYAAQLVWIGGKFPIDVCTPRLEERKIIIPRNIFLTIYFQIGVDFPWYPALGYNTSRPGP
jgi:programmed cell death 6-interacting protein